uniref:Secreted protein n=1 Tax=Steinernema glaseri TaxID=37863 RepID=A0A1I7YNB7_9BILA
MFPLLLMLLMAALELPPRSRMDHSCPIPRISCDRFPLAASLRHPPLYLFRRDSTLIRVGATFGAAKCD